MRMSCDDYDVQTSPGIPSTALIRKQRIAERAFIIAEERGFAPGRELDDWLQAELEISHELERQRTMLSRNGQSTSNRRSK